jgi:hypothetical protein
LIISQGADLRAEFGETNVAKLNLEERRNLCVIAAQKHVSLHFLDNDVAPAQPYEFEHDGRTEIDVAIPCPTSPTAYLRRGNSEIELQIVLLASAIDDYEFEIEERKPVLVTRGEFWMSPGPILWVLAGASRQYHTAVLTKKSIFWPAPLPQFGTTFEKYFPHICVPLFILTVPYFLPWEIKLPLEGVGDMVAPPQRSKIF